MICQCSAVAVLTYAPMAREVVDMIIDCLHDHPFALRSCSLVCREWLPRSRFHLFSTIELFGVYHSPFDEKAPPQPCDRLYAAIQRSPHIASIIRELYIHEGLQFKHESWVNKTHSLILLLNSLTHLEKLHLRHIDWIRIAPELRGAIRGIFTSNLITTLDLELCNFPVKSFIFLFSTWTNAKSLILRSMSVASPEIFSEEFKLVEDEEAGNEDGEIPRRKCQLDDLRIVGCPPEIMAWINDPENPLDLTHLRTLHCHINQATKTLLYELGGCLHHVVLMRPSNHDPKKDEIVKGILGSNNGLRSLHVTGICIQSNPYEDDGNPATRVKEILLSAFGAYHLQSIVMEINVYQDLSTIDWSWVTIDEVFDGATLPKLAKVEFQLPSDVTDGYHSHFRDVMTPLLPGLAKRGVLVFS